MERTLDAAATHHEGFWTARVAGAAGPARGWRRDVVAIGEALFARAGAAAPADRLAWLAEDSADFLAHGGSRAKLAFHACRLAVSWLAPLHIGGAPPLRLQPLDRRARALAAMERGPLGMAVLGVKAVLSMVWYEDPRSAAEIGFDGACAR